MRETYVYGEEALKKVKRGNHIDVGDYFTKRGYSSARILKITQSGIHKASGEKVYDVKIEIGARAMARLKKQYSDINPEEFEFER